MKKKTSIFLILFLVILICLIGFIGRFVYIQKFYPVWDVENKVHYPCDYPKPVMVDPFKDNPCLFRKIVKDCCGNMQSVPINYFYEECPMFVSCYSKLSSNFLNIRKVILYFLLLAIPMMIFKKTRWIGFFMFLAIVVCLFIGAIIDYNTQNDTSSKVDRDMSNLIDYYE